MRFTTPRGQYAKLNQFKSTGINPTSNPITILNTKDSVQLYLRNDQLCTDKQQTDTHGQEQYQDFTSQFEVK